MIATTNTGKADFTDIYDEPDAAAYFLTLGQLGYEIPQHGADVVNQLVATRAQDSGDARPTILDVCCSYGVGGMLMKTDLRLDEVYDHYRHAVSDGLRGDRLAEADAALLNEHARPDSPRVVGLDAARNATRYAVTIGALDEAFPENLETSEPSTDLVRQMDDIDVITSAGGVGYVTERTFTRLLDASARRPWVVAFCLRTYDYQPITDALAERGMVTEKAGHSFPQRRFVDDAEQQWAIAEVEARGLDSDSLETTGRCHADLYVSRPKEDASQLSLDELIGSPPVPLFQVG